MAVANHLNLDVGSTLELGNEHFEIVGIFRTDTSLLESGGLLPFEDAQRVAGLEGKFSGIYVAARLLLDGKLTPDVFTDEKVTEPIAIEAMDKIKPVLDETIPDIWKDSWTRALLARDGFTSRAGMIETGFRRGATSLLATSPTLLKLLV